MIFDAWNCLTLKSIDSTIGAYFGTAMMMLMLMMIIKADFFGTYGTISLIDVDGDTAYITFDNWEVKASLMLRCIVIMFRPPPMHSS